MKLKEETVLGYETDGETEINFYDLSEEVKQQILENQEKAEYHDKYVGYMSEQRFKLEQENKRLKEELSKTVGDYINLKNERDNLKHRLENIGNEVFEILDSIP